MNYREKNQSHVSFFLIIIVSAIFVTAIFCYPIYHKHSKQLKEKNQLCHILAAKKLESSLLLKERNALRNNPKAVEKVAREVFGYCREGETVMIYNQK